MFNELKQKLSILRQTVFSNKDRLDNLVLTDNNYTDEDKEKVQTIGVTPDTFFANGADYAEVGEWSDGNPNKENRLYRFVTLKSNGRKIAIANSTDQIAGVTTTKAAFVGNARNYKEDDFTKNIIGIIGVVPVRTNDNTIKANDRVMSDDNGYAVKSENNLGYRVLEVMGNGLLEIVVSVNTDMIQRIKTDMDKKADKSEIPDVSNFVQDDKYTHTDNNYTDEDKAQISNLTLITDEIDKNLSNLSNKVETLNEELIEQEETVNHLDDTKADKTEIPTKTSQLENDSIKSGEVVEIGQYQYTYEGTVLPAIPADILKTVYIKDKAGTPMILHWTLYGTENNLKIVSSDLIAGTYSIDVLVHNKYHCAYEWKADSTGNINPKVQVQEGGLVDDVKVNGVSVVSNKIANIDLSDFATKEYINSLDASEVIY